MTEKRCSRCGRTMPLDAFYTVHERGKERKASQCKECNREHTRRYWNAHRDTLNALQRYKRIFRKYR